MNFLRKMRNYYFYCGIEKDEYNALKKDAYVSNFKVWKILHFLMAAVFCVLYILSLCNGLIADNRPFYLIAFIYSVVAICAFFILKQDSLAAQFMIYLSMSFLFLFGCLITLNKPDNNATTFIVLLLVTPMFMIDKPFFMTIELCAASAVFLIWTYGVKSREIWMMDLVNVVTYTVVGSFLNVIANSVRIREFVLTREIRVQKDTDEMTGLRNRGALTRAVNEYFSAGQDNKGFMFILDVDKFKSINDIYGHDVGDSVIVQLGRYLGEKFTDNAITGRFGGDEFIVFIKDTDDKDTARETAGEIISEVSDTVELPDKDKKINISIGIAVCNSSENNYSEIFKKADIALYKAKAENGNTFCFCE